MTDAELNLRGDSSQFCGTFSGAVRSAAAASVDIFRKRLYDLSTALGETLFVVCLHGIIVYNGPRDPSHGLSFRVCISPIDHKAQIDRSTYSLFITHYSLLITQSLICAEHP